MAFSAGQVITAGDLNDLISGVFLAADQTVNTSTTLVNATGMAFSLSANATYAIDGWLRWTSNPTADIKFGWSSPASSDGWWSLNGPYVTGSPAVGGRERVNYADTSTVAITSALSAAGDDESTGTIDISARLGGYITTSTAGTLQLQFAQNTSDASDTILGEGSWLRVTRLDS
jgi:hypothetical protein